MKTTKAKLTLLAGVFAALAGIISAPPAEAADVTFDLTAMEGVISAPDGAQIYMWSFTDTGEFRYPGPTLDVTEGDMVTINLTNALPDTDMDGPVKPDPVSIALSGQLGVEVYDPDTATWLPVTPHLTVDGDKRTLRSFSAETAPGETVSYRFEATRPGTYQYFSATHPDKHTDMGLVGALIVRSNVPGTAYGIAGTEYDLEYLQIYTEVDPGQHSRVQRGLPYQTTAFVPEYWFINGRAFPDTISPDGASYLPAQPMSALIAMEPGQRVLMRLVGTGRDIHPMHHHGNHATVIGVNGSPLSSDGLSADLGIKRYTPVSNPGETLDTIYRWDAGSVDFGWDVYGTTPGEEVPVDVMPTMDNPNIGLAFGEAYSGSPYLGQQGDLAPADAAININMMGEMYVPFHSHHELELQNQGEGPGGMLTLIAILPPAAP